MVDVVALGLSAAAIIAKQALEEAGERTGEGGWRLLESVATRVRRWFARRGDDEGMSALEDVERYPDSQRAIEQLAAAIGVASEAEPMVAAELAALVEQAKEQGGPRIAKFLTEVKGNARVGRVVQTDIYNERA